MRKKPIKLQYIRPQTEMFATMGRPFMAKVSFYGDAGEGELEEYGDAKGSILDSEFSFHDVWEEE